MSVLKGSKGFYDFEISDILAHNVKNWLDYGLLEQGAYTNVQFNLPTSGLTNLKRIKDDRYSPGRIYEGFGPSWAWESGVNSFVAGKLPIFQVSGIYINGSFYPTSNTSGQYAHQIDYVHARVIFASGIVSESTKVQCEYVFRDVETFNTSDGKWKTLVEQYETNFDNLSLLGSSGLGMASILKQNRVWLPCVAIDVEDITSHPLQLGGGEFAACEVRYHIFSDKAFSAAKLKDILINQKSKTLSLYDLSKIPKIYEFNGSLANTALPYNTLSDRNGIYFWTYGGIDEAAGQYFQSATDVHRAEASHTISVQRYLSTY